MKLPALDSIESLIGVEDMRRRTAAHNQWMRANPGARRLSAPQTTMASAERSSRFQTNEADQIWDWDGLLVIRD